MVRRLFTESEGFFDQKKREPSMRRELLLLFLIGALGAAGVGYVGYMFLDAVAGERDLMRVQFVARALTVLVGPFVLWVYYTLVTQGVAYTMNSRGPLSRLFKITAWSLVPMAIANLVYSVAMFLAYRDVDVPENPPGTRVEDQVDFLFGLANDDPLLILAWIVTALAAVYSGYLLSIGLQRLRDLSESQARRAVSLPVVGHVAWVLYTLLGQLGIL